MFPRVRHALLLALLLIVPLQSMAAALKPLLCSLSEHSDVRVNAGAVHEHLLAQSDDRHLHTGAHDAHPAQGDNSNTHTCCHHVLSGAVGVTAIPAHQDFRVFSSSIAHLSTLHIPELLQRPPRV